MFANSIHEKIFPQYPFDADEVTAILDNNTDSARLDIGTDGGFLKKNGTDQARAVAAVFFGNKSKYNRARHCGGDEQDLNSFVAETQAVLDMLLHIPLSILQRGKKYNVNQVHVWLDAELVFKVITNIENIDPNSLLYWEFLKIRALINRYKKLHISIAWHWIPSHLDNKRKNNPDWFANWKKSKLPLILPYIVPYLQNDINCTKQFDSPINFMETQPVS